MNSARDYLAFLLNEIAPPASKAEVKASWKFARTDVLRRDRIARRLDKGLLLDESEEASEEPDESLKNFLEGEFFDSRVLDNPELLGDLILQPALQKTFDDMNALANRLGITTAPVNAFGMVPIGTPNAVAILVPDSYAAFRRSRYFDALNLFHQSERDALAINPRDSSFLLSTPSLSRISVGGAAPYSRGSRTRQCQHS